MHPCPPRCDEPLLSPSGVLPVAVNTAATAVSPGSPSTATAPTAATAAPPATAVSHLSDKNTQQHVEQQGQVDSSSHCIHSVTCCFLH